MYWFTSDEHFNHENILKLFVYRPFRSVDEMNTTIIQRHNARVKDNDIVFHLGDFKLTTKGSNSHEITKQLNGKHIFIAGNHDKNNGCNSPIKYCVINSYGKTILLIHRPEDAATIISKGGIDLTFCGHVHEKWKFTKTEHGDMVNVGVDQWDFYPVDAKQILKAYSRWRND